MAAAVAEMRQAMRDARQAAQIGSLA